MLTTRMIFALILTLCVGSQLIQAKLNFADQQNLSFIGELTKLLEGYANGIDTPYIEARIYRLLKWLDLNHITAAHEYFVQSLSPNQLESLKFKAPRVYILAEALKSVVPVYYYELGKVGGSVGIDSVMDSARYRLIDHYKNIRGQLLGFGIDMEYLANTSVGQLLSAIACDDQPSVRLDGQTFQRAELELAAVEKQFLTNDMSLEAAIEQIDRRAMLLGTVPTQAFLREVVPWLQEVKQLPVDSAAIRRTVLEKMGKYTNRVQYQFRC